MSFFKKIKKNLMSCKASGNLLKVKFLGMIFKFPLEKILTSNNICIPSKKYGKIYLPYYNQNVTINSSKPNIYNADGQKMDTYFLRDYHSAHCPHSIEMSSKYFLWDRFDFGLDTHFYTQNAMLETMGKPKNRYGMLIESPSIVPTDYLIFEKNKTLSEDFDLIFTYDDKILDKVKNAKFFPFFAAPWYGGDFGGKIIPDGYKYKTKNVSIISANKRMCHLHDVRIAIAQKCKDMSLADTYGTFDGGAFVKNGVSLENYRYSIVVENDLSPLFFTQKITSCFAAQTIPIYLGTKSINKFFNADGIIQIEESDIDNLDKILLQCNEKDYMVRLPAIQDNYKRVLQYVNMFDWLYEKYLRGENK